MGYHRGETLGFALRQIFYGFVNSFVRLCRLQFCCYRKGCGDNIGSHYYGMDDRGLRRNNLGYLAIKRHSSHHCCSPPLRHKVVRGPKKL